MTAAPQVPRNPTVLIIMDGVGINENAESNALSLAYTPRLDTWFSRFPMVPLEASGLAVGLPEGQGGNSEVGHLTLGSGMVLQQDLVRINASIKTGDFYQNAELIRACDQALQRQRPLHLIGLVSDGGVHSHIRHLLALIDVATRCGVVPNLHLISDGRDTSPRAVARYVKHLEMPLRHAGGCIASVCGRFFAMDRNERWERTEATWRLLTHAEGRQAGSVDEAIEKACEAGETDEFISPTWIEGGEPVLPGDPVICFNYRNDRVRQIASALAEQEFDAFSRGDFTPVNLFTMTEYDPELSASVVFAKQICEKTLASVISDAGLRQLHVAETEKYAHVTFFFNGGRQTPMPGEDRILVPSPHVKTYDEAPEMSASIVADKVIDAIDTGDYAFIVVNFANGDMVGHTGIPEAIIKAVEAVDEAVGRVLDKAQEAGFSAIVTADHGNCEQMVDQATGEALTQHTANPVPCLVVDEFCSGLESGHGLASIAPTVLDLMGLEPSACMHGGTLIKRRKLVRVA